MKRCTGHGVHPFDAQEMDSELLGAYNSAQSKERRATQHARQFWFPLIQELPPVHYVAGETCVFCSHQMRQLFEYANRENLVPQTSFRQALWL